ncbi:MAG: PKD domain-containing protein [Gammaproteobacteria bacterium]|nr:PKD domain-containing protein [Gammaproteobacteria bacterium]
MATDASAATATVGLQVDWVRGVSQSYDTASSNLTAGKAWRWKLDTGAPTANAGATQNVNGNTLVTLSGSGTDPDGGTLKYNWTQIAGTAVTLSNPNVAGPTFFAPNVTGTLTFQLTVTDDANLSTTATVNINVTAVAAAGVLQFNASTYVVNENVGTASIIVDRVGGSTGSVGITYATSDGTAAAGSDYTFTSGTLNWADGDAASKTISVPITNDSVAEINENLSVLLSNAIGGATSDTAVTTLTINDNDGPGMISLSATTYSIAENAAIATITVTRTNGSVGVVSVDFSTSDGTATAGSDYTATSGTVSWADGDSASKTFTISVLDDTVYEADETINIGLTNGLGASVGTASATLTVVENETVNHAPGTVVLISPTDNSSNVDGTAVTFKWNRVTDIDGDTVSYKLYYCDNAAFTGCTPSVIAKADIPLNLIASLGGGSGILILGLIGVAARRQRYALNAMTVGLLFISSGCGGNLPPATPPSNTATKLVSTLMPTTTYYWKVVAEDGRGLSSTSTVWSFTTK